MYFTQIIQAFLFLLSYNFRYFPVILARKGVFSCPDAIAGYLQQAFDFAAAAGYNKDKR